MNLEKLLGLQDGYLKRLADFYYPLEVTDTATIIPHPSLDHKTHLLAPEPAPDGLWALRAWSPPASRRREFDASTREAQEFSFSRLREKVAAKRSRPKVRLGNKKLTDEGSKGCPPTQKHLEVQP